MIDDEDDLEDIQIRDKKTLVSNVNIAQKSSTLLNDEDDDSVVSEEALLEICNDEQGFGK